MIKMRKCNIILMGVFIFTVIVLIVLGLVEYFNNQSLLLTFPMVFVFIIFELLLWYFIIKLNLKQTKED